MSEILGVIGDIDITKYIIKDTYKVNSEPVYESWQDGNFRSHRIYTRTKVTGSFDVIFFGEDDGPYQDFLALIASETSQNVLTIGLYVENEAAFESFEVYCELTSSQHAETTDGRIVNKVTVQIEER